MNQLVVYTSCNQGLGLFAKREIDKDQIVIEYIGEMIKNELADVREQAYNRQVNSYYIVLMIACLSQWWASRGPHTNSRARRLLFKHCTLEPLLSGQCGTGGCPVVRICTDLRILFSQNMPKI